MLDARISDVPFDAQAELQSFLAGLGGEGAVASFVGLARPTASDGADVAGLFLDHHPVLTQGSVTGIATAAMERFSVTSVRVVHRFGEVDPGAPIVFVAAASAHRRAALEAVDYMMDRLKTEGMFWKREDTCEGARWIEPTEADYAERVRWSDNDL